MSDGKADQYEALKGLWIDDFLRALRANKKLIDKKLNNGKGNA